MEAKSTREWRLGESLERPFEETVENKEFYDKLRSSLPPTASQYALNALKSLGPEYTTQIPYGREMFDKAAHWMDFLKEMLDPNRNNLQSPAKAGYLFAVFPEVEQFYDNHDLVDSNVLVFDLVFVGRESSIPAEANWKQTAKCSMLGSKFIKMNTAIYSLDDRCSATRLHLGQVLYNGESVVNKGDVEEIRKHYGLPETLAKDSLCVLKQFDPFRNFHAEESNILSSNFCESFLWSEEFGTKGHPILRPNTVPGVPRSCMVDHRIGDPELLLWKEKRAETYFQDVMKECNLKYKDKDAKTRLFGESGVGANIAKLDKLTKTADINNMFSTVSPHNDANNSATDRPVIPGFDEKSMSVGVVAKPKQTTLDSFYRKKPKSASSSSEDSADVEMTDCTINDKKHDEAMFLAKNADYFEKEFNNSSPVSWLPSLSRLSHLSAPLSKTVLLNRDWLIARFGTDLGVVMYPQDDKTQQAPIIDPARINILELEKSVHVYRCFMNTNISHYHYRSFRKKVPEPPPEIINDDILTREMMKKGLVHPYTECALFHKESLEEKSNEFKRRRDPLIDSKEPEDEAALDETVREAMSLRLFDHLNLEKYEKANWEIYTPEFIQKTIKTTKVALEDELKALQASQNSKVSRMLNDLFKPESKTKRERSLSK